MEFKYSKRVAQVALVTLILVHPVVAVAYVGPGAGLSIIGSLLAFFAAIVVGIFGFVWFPVRRYLRKRKLSKAETPVSAENSSDDLVDGTSDGEVKRGGSDA